MILLTEVNFTALSLRRIKYLDNMYLFQAKYTFKLAVHGLGMVCFLDIALWEKEGDKLK
ncbi:hypothetical protein [Ruminiclostridium sufflavum]|uniref:hypothetical protein n=1 Tax=Ruminiclostridium sufflavum TaxID=396504 RepID=UPI001A9A3015|nr:hypothetical protein [Ruminiclostridium sufflavum]